MGRDLLEEVMTAKRARPQGVVVMTGRPLHLTTHSGPCRAYGARFAVRFAPRAAWLGTGITHPLYPPGIPQPCTHLGLYWRHARVTCHGWHGAGVAGACTYDRFESTVGEPRGIEHTPYSRVLAVFSTHWFYGCLHLIMTETGVMGRV